MSDQGKALLPSHPPDLAAARSASGSPPAPGTLPPPGPKVDPYVGKTIDNRYIVDAVLGEGGMGIVYRARHKVIGKKVAIKVLKNDMARDREATERFLQEAKAASSIGNPHIVDISDFGDLPDGSTYFVMEYLEGSDLRNTIEDDGLDVARIIRIARQIAAGLAAAHKVGIVHRDLKPDNIMLIARAEDPEFVKILDFGIAKVGAETKITRAGSIFGTPHYMSPEQAAGTPVDQRTDIYALGVMIHEMAAGKVPFDADNFMGILTQHMYKAPVPLRAVIPPLPNIPAGLEAIVLKCLEKKPELRYASMEELGADLAKLEKGLAPDAIEHQMNRSSTFSAPANYFQAAMPHPVPATPDEIPKKSRLPLFAAIGAVGTVGIVVLAVSLSGSTSRAQNTTGADGPSRAVPTQTAAPIPPPMPATAEPTLQTHSVVLVIEPLDAKVSRDGQDQGSAPFTFEVKAGETINLIATRSGFHDQAIAVDEKSDPKLVVKLVPQPATGTHPPTGHPSGAAHGGKKACAPGDPDCYSDPWAK